MMGKRNIFLKKSYWMFLCTFILAGCSAGYNEEKISLEAEKTEPKKVTIEETDIEPGVDFHEIEPEDFAQSIPKEPEVIETDWSEYFSGLNGAAVMYDAANGRYTMYNSKVALTRRSPCSTFKIISSLAALENGLIDPEDSTRTWSGEVFWNEDWNRDISFREAFRTSCVWYYREVIDDIGKEMMQRELDKLGYGNCDISDWEGRLNTNNNNRALTGFWIESSLLISPKEQVEVMERIFGENSIYSTETQDVLKQVMLVSGQDMAQVSIYGKTGMGKADGNVVDAWFTGFAENEEEKIYFCVYLGRTEGMDVSSLAAKDIAIQLVLDYFEEPYAESQELEESAYWFIPQADNCLLSKEETERLQCEALLAAESVSEIYQEAEIADMPGYFSGISEFSGGQRKAVVEELGKHGLVSVEDDTNMQNYEEVETFYEEYLNDRDAMVTIFAVNGDGLIGANTFIYRGGALQAYYVGIRWKEGAVPEIQGVSVSDVAEINLTEKGYFIYSYEIEIIHGSLRQYWRVKPLSDKCRELTQKYIAGLSYVNYNMLVTDWNADNVEDILMPCMFEDIYHIYIGENIKTENGRIPARQYEQIMTTCFPVSKEQLRKHCGYRESDDSYEYEMIFGKQYPPFGEVVDYTENSDGTITLFVDGVWPDYNSDLAFTNQIVIRPFEDGTFRYLSNSIQQKELEIPR